MDLHRRQRPAVDQRRNRRVEIFRRASFPRSRPSHQVSEVRGRVLVELQCPCDTVHDLIGRSSFAALLNAQVVVDADACQCRDFLAAQSGDPAAPPAGESDVGRLELFTSVAEELC